jgi:holo-[acyl-carrier protein] synthase
MIVGLGIDVTPVSRFSQAAGREGLLRRIFTEAEQDSSMQRMAGRFAAKEALAKALGAPVGMAWHDVTVLRPHATKPELSVSGAVAARAAELGVVNLHLSISHDAGIASAVVVAEGA